MPTRKELIEQCKARGLHGYSRKSKQELEALLAPQETGHEQEKEKEKEKESPDQDSVATMPPESVTEQSEQSKPPIATLPLRAWAHTWVAVCLGIPPYLRPYIKPYPNT